VFGRCEATFADFFLGWPLTASREFWPLLVAFGGSFLWLVAIRFLEISDTTNTSLATDGNFLTMFLAISSDLEPST